MVCSQIYSNKLSCITKIKQPKLRINGSNQDDTPITHNKWTSWAHIHSRRRNSHSGIHRRQDSSPKGRKGSLKDIQQK